MKSVYCIVVTYNGVKWIKKCLSSLQENSNDVKIICVDNGSTDDTVSIIKKYFPSVHLLELAQNLGFGQANNIGMRVAIFNKADYVFLLNQDAWVEHNTIAALISIHTLNPQYGVISPLHLNGTGEKMDTYFFKYLAESDVRSVSISESFHKEQNEVLISTEFVNAAAWLISMACLKKTGVFDPIFFHYGEDRHYLQRIKYWGFKTGIYSGVNIYHDRELRISKTSINIESRVKTEWVHFLGRACDINYSGYLKFSLKRLARHLSLFFKNLILFNRIGTVYNYIMAMKIFFSLNKIRQSREISASQKLVPYL